MRPASGMSRWRQLLVLAAFLPCGCERAMHDMYDQPRYTAQQPSTLFADGSSARTPPPGSVAMASGAAADASSARLGHLAPVAPAPAALPLDAKGKARGSVQPNALSSGRGARVHSPPITLALVQRGRERFDIYCAPCHGRSGDGAGMIVQRGFPAPPSYHTARLRNAPDGHFYGVISNGYGVMYPYAERIAPHDRWAIVAYIRALQLSQHARADMLQPQDRERLGAPAQALRGEP